jgi:hypothetical protein
MVFYNRRNNILIRDIMKNKLIICLVVFLFFISSIPISYASLSSHDRYINKSVFSQNQTDEDILDQHSLYKGLMRPDFSTIKKWKEDYHNAKKAYIDPKLDQNIQTMTSYSILDLLDYIPSERNQQYCGNCWAWPATGVVGIALNIQEGIFDRLSVQYINSCGYQVGIGCCAGGNLDLFCRFYRLTDKVIPWSNENAHWQDRLARCEVECDSISTTPFYPISSIYPTSIETHEIPEEEAISNIKNILHQQKGIYFSFLLPDQEYLTDFNEFWSNDREDEIYEVDWACGKEYIEEEGAGHAVLCVGYNDEEGTENDYWIMLNSWGITTRRLTGLFRINMHMDYDCEVIYQGRKYYSFDFETLNVTFGSEEGAPNPPLIEGPTSGKKETEYTYSISAVDAQNDDVFITVEWGDGSKENWMGPLSSGEVLELNHSWAERGDYTISAKARDINDDESFWSTLEVSMTKRKALTFSFSYLIFERIYQFFPFLKLGIG